MGPAARLLGRIGILRSLVIGSIGVFSLLRIIQYFNPQPKQLCGRAGGSAKSTKQQRFYWTWETLPHWIKRQSRAVVGMSLENGYFSAGTVKRIVAECSSVFSEVVVMIPDLPAYHTYLAFGHSPAKAKKKMHRHAVNMQNKVMNSLLELDKEQRNRVKMVNWATVGDNEAYTNILAKVKCVFEHDVEFRRVVEQATGAVVGRQSEPQKIDVRVGVESLLMEMAFLETLDAICPPEQHRRYQVFVYHKDWEVYRYFVQNVSAQVCCMKPDAIVEKCVLLSNH